MPFCRETGLDRERKSVPHPLQPTLVQPAMVVQFLTICFHADCLLVACVASYLPSAWLELLGQIGWRYWVCMMPLLLTGWLPASAYCLPISWCVTGIDHRSLPACRLKLCGMCSQKSGSARCGSSCAWGDMAPGHDQCPWGRALRLFLPRGSRVIAHIVVSYQFMLCVTSACH